MAKTTPRLFVDQRLAAGTEVTLPQAQAHYLINVLRMSGGDPVAAFNGEDGEWLCHLVVASKKSAVLRCEKLRAAAQQPPDIDFVFAPIKHTRLEFIVEKAVELGARRLQPVITERTVASRVNIERMQANAVEAAEQCNLVFVPQMLEPVKLNTLLQHWPKDRTIVFCDETAVSTNPLALLKTLRPPVAVLVGPEGGFTDAERAMLNAMPLTKAISLGPRIMRAETAGLAALTIVQAAMGDWGVG